MRCLYCGNELALLKKLRGGGEFCSEAHRQKYQEEYTQLALNRLKQAHPKTQKRTPSPPAADERPARQPEPPPQPVPPEPAKPAISAPEPCGFLLQRLEPRPCETEPFSHGPMPLEALSAALQRTDERAETSRTLPRADRFRSLQFALRQSAPPQLAAPEFVDFRLSPEFKQIANTCLRLLTADDVSLATVEAPSEQESEPEPVMSGLAAPNEDSAPTAEATPEPEPEPVMTAVLVADQSSVAAVESGPEPESVVPGLVAQNHDTVASTDAMPELEPEPVMAASAVRNEEAVAAVESLPEPQPEIAEHASRDMTPARRPAELRKVILRLAPPPNSGPQDICRPAPFPVSGPDLPTVKPNVLRLKFGFAASPARPAAPQLNNAGASRNVENPGAGSVAHSFLTFETPDLGGAKPEGRSKLPLILSVAGALVLVAVAAIFMFTRGTSSTAPLRPKAQSSPSPIPEADWTADWSGKPPRGEQFSILRPSLIMSDYRIQFQGQIESKSLGWIFRATDPKNYYALKLEITKPGAMAEVSLIRAVVDAGQQKNRARIPLKTFARDTVFKIRTDVAGSTFQTWIQGDLVDTWNDDRFRVGGFGLLTDAAGRAKLQMIQLSELQDRAHKL